LTSTDQLRRTPLHELHVEAGGKLVEFAGWELPVQYTGVIDEHQAVRTRAGLFDVSHMGQVLVRGAGARDFLQRVTCNDLAGIEPGRAQYNALTTPAGTFVDDLLIYVLDAEEYMLVVNASNAAKDVAWLDTQARGFDGTVEDVSHAWALLSLQGPRAAASLAPLVSSALLELRYYRFARAAVCSVPCIVSRTGYTGEDGFEIYVPPAEAPRLWREILAAGAPHGVVPAGLGARDTLRLEARMALYGNDIDETTTVLEADLAWIVKLDKGEFIGREALARQVHEGVPRKLVGFELCGRGIARHGHPVRFQDSGSIGHVTSGTYSPTLRKSIGLAYLPCERSAVGQEFAVEIRGRAEPARVVPTPFYRRPR
jgi:aminomethyltransferase